MWESLEVLELCLMRISDSASMSCSYEATELDWAIHCAAALKKITASLPPMFLIRPPQDLVGKVFNGFLFTMPERRGRGMSLERPLCTDLSTRRAALSVLAAAARKSPKAMSILLDNVRHDKEVYGRWGSNLM